MGTYTKYLNTIQTGGTNVVTSGGSKSYANIISSYQKPKATPTPTTYASPTPTVTLNKPKVLNTVGNFLKTSAEKISKTKPTDYIMGAGQDVVSKSLRQYVSDSFKATSEVVKSLYKIIPIYEISQNIKGEKVTPKENLKNSIDLALNTISAIYRTSPAAPVIGAVSGSLKESRQESQRVISILASKEDKRVKATKLLNLPTDASDEQIADATKNYKRNYTGRLLNAAISGVTEQPGVGAVITDNPVAQSIIDVAFMAIMISRPFIKKKLNKLNLKANELAKVSETLEVKPNASMEEISISYKNKVTQYKDVFAGRGTPEQIAQVQKLNDSYNILKKTNVFERVYAGLFGKVNPSDFNVLNEAPLAIREKAGLSTDVKVPTTPEIVKTTPSGEVIVPEQPIKTAIETQKMIETKYPGISLNEIKEGNYTTEKIVPIDTITPSQSGADLYTDTADLYAQGGYSTFSEPFGGGKETFHKGPPLTNPEQLPPIVVDSNNKIIDGNQRWAALKQVGVTDIKVIQKVSTPEVKPFDFQNVNQEVIIHGKGVGGEWKNGNSYRYKLENAGDIFRETTKSSPDDGYIREKVTKLDALLTKIENNKLHPDDSLEYSSNENPGKFAELKKLWQQQPVTSPEQQIAKDLNLALIDGDFTKARTLLNQIQSPPLKTGVIPEGKGITLYRGGNKIDNNKAGGAGISLTTDNNIANTYIKGDTGKVENGVVEKFILDKSAKLFNSEDLPLEILTQLNSKNTQQQIFGKENASRYVSGLSEKYDGIDLSKWGQGEIRIFNPDKLKPSTLEVKTKKRPIAEVKEELSATKTNIEETKAKSKAVAESAQVARAEINTKDVALLKRIYFKSQKFQEGDIETIRNSNTGKLLNNVIENVQEKFPNMSEQDAFDYAMQLPTKASEIPKRSPEIKELSQKLKAIETEYQDYVEKNKLGIGVRKKAIENGIRISMKDLPEYEKVSVDDQAEQALKILVTDPAYALDIALGKVEPPPGLLPESMFNAVEVDALARGDAETLLQLATQSSLVSDATVMGQRLRMLAERNPDSPVSMMKDVIKEKQKALEKKTGKSTSENVKEETAKLKESIDKAKPDKMDWRAFIESIKCK